MTMLHVVAHCVFLLLGIVGSFCIRIVVGAAGHASEAGTGDYLLYAYCTLSIIALVFLYRIRNRTFHKVLLFLNSALALTGSLSLAYIIYSMIWEGVPVGLQVLLSIFSINGSILAFRLAKRILNKRS